MTKKSSKPQTPKTWNLPEDKLDEIRKNISIIVLLLAPNFKFGPYEYEDLEMEALTGMNDKYEKFDPTRGTKLYSFMYTCIYRLLYNLKRDKFKRFSPPCVKCPFDAYIDKKCVKYENLSDCKHYDYWEKINSQKQNLMHVYSVEDGREDDNRSTLEVLADKEQIEYLAKNLSKKNQETLNLFLQKEKVSPKKFQVLVEECRELCGDE